MRNVMKTILAVSAVICAAASGALQAQAYPGRSMHINTGGTGSVGDLSSRLIAPKLSERLGQQVVVENRPSGPVLGGLVARAAPDGHTLLVTGNSFWLLPFFQQDLNWDPVKDFLPVSQLTASPSVLVVHPSVPAKSVKELIAYIKARPGKLHWGSGPYGTANHLAGEQFKISAGLDMVRIPYKGVGQALVDLISGQVQLMFPVAGAMTAHAKAGRLRALAVSSATKSALVPDLPTVAESGDLPGFESISIVAMFLPAKSPAAVAARLNSEVRAVLGLPEIKDKLFGAGVEAMPTTPEQLMGVVKSDIALVARLVKEGAIKIE
jgi:tripartite-type tricarboxylate transporter receptor subunit TctC